MATSIKLKRKSYTQWDETDNLKRMKDSDILAEKPRKTTDYSGIAKTATLGTIAGGAAGITAGAVKGAISKPAVGSTVFGNIAGKAKTGGKLGLLAGATIAGVAAYKKGNKQAEENQFYNDRLAYAKRQALRRERKDWKTNMTQRDGYSY